MTADLVSAEWLKKHLGKSELVLLDSSPYSTAAGKSARFDDLYIPRSRIFNIKETFSNADSKFPNTFPSVEKFEEESRRLGINKDSEIVVYDNLGLYTSPRVWWMYRVMGHRNVKVLNGGLPEWIRSGGETERTPMSDEEYLYGNFKGSYREECLVKYSDVMDNISSDNFILVDARSEGRYQGKEPEPRKHLESGSIPNSINIPYNAVLDDGMYKDIEKLRNIFESKITHQKKLVFSCGSGITACIVMLACHMAYSESYYLYDGSWTEYAELNNLLV